MTSDELKSGFDPSWYNLKTIKLEFAASPLSQATWIPDPHKKKMTMTIYVPF